MLTDTIGYADLRNTEEFVESFRPVIEVSFVVEENMSWSRRMKRCFAASDGNEGVCRFARRHLYGPLRTHPRLERRSLEIGGENTKTRGREVSNGSCCACSIRRQVVSFPGSRSKHGRATFARSLSSMSYRTRKRPLLTRKRSMTSSSTHLNASKRFDRVARHCSRTITRGPGEHCLVVPVRL